MAAGAATGRQAVPLYLPAGRRSRTFPLRQAYKAFIVNGYSNKQFTVSGDCSGTATQSSSAPPQDAVFDGVPAHAITLTGALQLSNCGTGQAASLSNQYFATNSDPNVVEYSTLGAVDADGSVARFETPLTMPECRSLPAPADRLGTESHLCRHATSRTPVGRTVQALQHLPRTMNDTVLVRLTADTYDDDEPV